MKYFIGNTDFNWFEYLSNLKPEDVNFWKPYPRNFNLLSSAEPFLFRLKNPINKIGGIGFFTNSTVIPIEYAWEVFGNRNGCETFDEFYNMVLKYKEDKNNFDIGCIVLTNPIFFEEKDWIDIPSDWKMNVPAGNLYNTEISIGKKYWERVEHTVKYYLNREAFDNKDLLLVKEPDSPMYGNPILTKVRIGQGAFKIDVLKIYNKRCSISGERTLPTLEAAHIKSYSKSGPHYTSNGLLLRSDIHKLFDTGYITITSDLKVEVSKRIKEEFENGREYYQFHGKDLSILPLRNEDRPFRDYVDWHNANIYKG